MKKVLFYISIILGYAAPSIELSEKICSGIFFNPLPTIWHIIGFYLIPTFLLVISILIKKDITKQRGKLLLLLSLYTIIFSLAWSIWFLTISWISLIGILFFGIGFLGLAPFFLLYSAFMQYKEVKNQIIKEEIISFKVNPLHSLYLILPVLLLIWWNPILLNLGEQKVESDDISSKYTGLSILENFVSGEEIARRCLGMTQGIFWMFNERMDHAELRKAFYFIYGTKPEDIRISGDYRFFGRRAEFDFNQGEDKIGKVFSDLQLKESIIDIASNFNEGHSYIEWTMIFKNESRIIRREARSIIQLPANSVVSKVSLWVDGEEREAAFGSTAKVKSIYKKIVKRRMDPLLVTMSGPSQVNVSCFPVPVQGEMKIRIGITAPLDDGRVLDLPHFENANFTIPKTLLSSVWIESDRAIIQNQTKTKDTKVKLDLNNDDLKNPETYFFYDESPANTIEFKSSGITFTRFEQKKTEKGIILLIDGSKEIISELQQLNLDTQKFSEIIVSAPYDFTVWDKTKTFDSFLGDVKKFKGINSSSALTFAVDKAVEDDLPIIWLHGELPQEFSEQAKIEQILRRSNKSIKLVTVNVSDKFNAIISDLLFSPYIIDIPSYGSKQEIFNKAIETAEVINPSDQDENIYLNGKYSSGLKIHSNGTENASHPFRLYLFSKIMQQWNRQKEIDNSLIVKAINARIVTPFTGAVVLENEDQYKEAKLDPSIGADNIPRIPEPEFYILLAITAIMLLSFYFLKERLGMAK